MSFTRCLTVLLAVDRFVVRLEDADLASVRERLEPDPVALLGGRIEDQHVGHVQRRLRRDDAARHALRRPHVSLHLRVET